MKIKLAIAALLGLLIGGCGSGGDPNGLLNAAPTGNETTSAGTLVSVTAIPPDPENPPVDDISEYRTVTTTGEFITDGAFSVPAGTPVFLHRLHTTSDNQTLGYSLKAGEETVGVFRIVSNGEPAPQQ